MSVECQVNVKSQSELDIGGRETCTVLWQQLISFPMLEGIKPQKLEAKTFLPGWIGEYLSFVCSPNLQG